MTECICKTKINEDIMTEKHTPTPWTHKQFEGFSHMVCSHEVDYDVVVRNCSKADAEFIVKACNMHAELVETLKYYANAKMYEHDDDLHVVTELGVFAHGTPVLNDNGNYARHVLNKATKG